MSWKTSKNGHRLTFMVVYAKFVPRFLNHFFFELKEEQNKVFPSVGVGVCSMIEILHDNVRWLNFWSRASECHTLHCLRSEHLQRSESKAKSKTVSKLVHGESSLISSRWHGIEPDICCVLGPLNSSSLKLDWSIKNWVKYVLELNLLRALSFPEDMSRKCSVNYTSIQFTTIVSEGDNYVFSHEKCWVARVQGFGILSPPDLTWSEVSSRGGACFQRWLAKRILLKPLQ